MTFLHVTGHGELGCVQPSGEIGESAWRRDKEGDVSGRQLYKSPLGGVSAVLFGQKMFTGLA